MPLQVKDPDAKPYPRMVAPVSGGGAMPVSAAMGMKRGKSQVRPVCPCPHFCALSFLRHRAPLRLPLVRQDNQGQVCFGSCLQVPLLWRCKGGQCCCV